MPDRNHSFVVPARKEWWGWCEHWEGSAAELEAAGIQLSGVLTPNAFGTKTWEAEFLDALGLLVRIVHHDWTTPGQFHVYRPYREHEPRPAEPFEMLNGNVRHTRGGTGYDHYSGTAPALAALGLARPDEFPGQPGRGKRSATYDAQGRESPIGGRGGKKPQPGHRTIKRCSATRYDIAVRVSHEEEAKRAAEQKAQLDESRRLNAIAMAHRVAFLEGMQLQARQAAARGATRSRSHLKLVWSNPS